MVWVILLVMLFQGASLDIVNLRVEPERVRSGFKRSEYGTLYRSLEDEIIAVLPQSNCKVLTPYTCKEFPIRDDGTAATDIEHIVSLAEAHDSGLDPSRRREFAGDLDNLTVADPSVNRYRKRDKDAGEWMPLRNRGWFARQVIAVKLKYRLSVDVREYRALVDALDESPGIDCSR